MAWSNANAPRSLASVLFWSYPITKLVVGFDYPPIAKAHDAANPALLEGVLEIRLCVFRGVPEKEIGRGKDIWKLEENIV